MVHRLALGPFFDGPADERRRVCEPCRPDLEADVPHTRRMVAKSMQSGRPWPQGTNREVEPAARHQGIPGPCNPSRLYASHQEYPASSRYRPDRRDGLSKANTTTALPRRMGRGRVGDVGRFVRRFRPVLLFAEPAADRVPDLVPEVLFLVRLLQHKGLPGGCLVRVGVVSGRVGPS